jgi:hypothetical protein
MELRAMIDLLRGALEWFREHGVTPWIVLWLAGGFLVLRFLGMVGAAVNRTAQGLWAHYSEAVRMLEEQRDDARRDAASAHAELMLLREQVRIARSLRRTIGKEDEE